MLNKLWFIEPCGESVEGDRPIGCELTNLKIFKLQ